MLWDLSVKNTLKQKTWYMWQVVLDTDDVERGLTVLVFLCKLNMNGHYYVLEFSLFCLIQVKAAEIITSDQFTTGCTLRFPRVEKIRNDKAWHECMTLEGLDDLRQVSQSQFIIAHIFFVINAPTTLYIASFHKKAVKWFQ